MVERPYLLLMHNEGFKMVEASFGHVDDRRRIKAKTDIYSAPPPIRRSGVVPTAERAIVYFSISALTAALKALLAQIV